MDLLAANGLGGGFGFGFGFGLGAVPAFQPQPSLFPPNFNAPAQGPGQLQQLVQMLQQLIVAVQQLQGGYRGMMGRDGQRQPGFGGYQGPSQPGVGNGYSGQPGNVRPGQGNAGGAGGAGGAQELPRMGAVPGPRPVRDTDPGFQAWVDNPRALGQQERTRISQLDEGQRAALHLWGIQAGSEGKNNGGVYFNVLNNPNQFKPAEVELVRRLYDQEMQMYGGVTGRLLDREFFGLYEGMTGKDISGRYANRPLEFANGPVNMENRTTGRNGLGEYDNLVIRLWGHDRWDNGANDGSIVEFTARNERSLDADIANRQRGNLNALLAADYADDGRRDGSALERAFVDSMDRIYLGGPGADANKTMGEAGLNQVNVGSVLDRIRDRPMPGIPPGIDITNMANIGKCPFFKGAVGGGQIRIRS